MKPIITVQDYIALITAFLDGRVPITRIQEEYHKLFYGSQDSYSEETFHILDALFAEIDAYWPAIQPGDPEEATLQAISEPTLRHYAAEALVKLNATINAS